MLAYLAQRLALLAGTFLVITVIGFAIIRLAPGDPVDYFYGGGADGAGTEVEQLENIQRAKAELRRQLGLDGPLRAQYLSWLFRTLRGDFGESLKDSRPVWDKIIERVPLTVTLNTLSILLTFAIAIPLGIMSAVRAGGAAVLWVVSAIVAAISVAVFGSSGEYLALVVGGGLSLPFAVMAFQGRERAADQALTLGVFMLYSLPSFWVGTLIIIFFCGGDYLNWFPPAGIHSNMYDPDWPLLRRVGDYMYHLAMPLVVTTYSTFAFTSRILRASMVEVKAQDFIRTARAKGLPERTVILKHILRNSIIPIVTNLGLLLPALLGGSVIIETIFSLPGLGYLGYESILARDYPVVLALFSVGSALTLLGILISDLLLVAVDPRISFGESRA